MGAELEEEFAAEVQLISSSGGVFEVVVDGKLVYSKKDLLRFPKEREIAHLLQGMPK